MTAKTAKTAKADFGVTGARVLRTMKALAGHTVTGISNVQIAREIRDSPSNVARSLQTLVNEDFAMQLDNGTYAPGIALLQMARVHFDHMRSLQRDIDDTVQRVG